MICPNCGSRFDNGAFCTNCGTKLVPENAAAPAAAPTGVKLYFGTDGISLINYKFQIKDAFGNVKYTAATVTESMTRMKSRLYDLSGNTILDVFQQSKLTFSAINFDIIENGQVVSEVIQKNNFTSFTYLLPQFGISIEGDFFSWNFCFYNSNHQPIGAVSKKVLSFGDHYEIDLADAAFEKYAIAAVMAIQLVTANMRRKRRR